MTQPSDDPIDLGSEDGLREKPDAQGSAAAPRAPGGLTSAVIELRAEMARSLRPGAFPAGRQRLIEVALEEDASEGLVAVLRQLPDDRQYEVVEQVMAAVGPPREEPRIGPDPDTFGGG